MRSHLRRTAKIERSEYHGHYVDFPPVRCNPKPAQKPHPPVLLDGNARNVLNREARWGDGWLPIGVTPEDIKRSRAILSELAEVAERDPDSISITIHCQPPDRDMIDQFEEAGADRVLLRIGAPDQARALAQAEEFANAVLR